MTPVRSCSRLQPSSDISVALLVRRVIERVMLTTTTDEDMATHRPSTSATSSGWPRTVEHHAGDDGGGQDLQRGRGQQRAVLPSQSAHVELDADLEEQQHHADVGQQAHLLLVGLAVLGQQLEGDQADHQVADDRGQAEAAGDEPEDRCREEHRAELEDRDGGLFHACQRTRSRRRAATPRMPRP